MSDWVSGKSIRARSAQDLTILAGYPARPMTGFMSTLTPAQRATALAYRGDDTHGR
jgi:hypothetical protein